MAITISTFTHLNPNENTLGYVLFLILSQPGFYPLLVDLTCDPKTSGTNEKNLSLRYCQTHDDFLHALTQNISEAPSGDYICIEDEDFLNIQDDFMLTAAFNSAFDKVTERYDFVIFNCPALMGGTGHFALLHSDFSVHQIDPSYCEGFFWSRDSLIKKEKPNLKFFCLPVLPEEASLCSVNDGCMPECILCPDYRTHSAIVKKPARLCLADVISPESHITNFDIGYYNFASAFLVSAYQYKYAKHR